MRPGRLSLIALIFLLGLLGYWGFRLFTPEPDAVLGEVRDENGPLPGALVRFKGQTSAAHTDEQGRFRLRTRGTDEETVTAWKDGYFIVSGVANRQPIRIELRRLPAEDNAEYAWIDSTPSRVSKDNCGNCHAEMYREWSASGHANTATNRRFLSLYDGTDYLGEKHVGWSLRDEYPDGTGVCTACHAPTVPHGDPAYSDLGKVQGTPRLGIHCDYCHKVADAGLGTIGLTHGRFGLQLLRPAEGQLFFGPLDDVDRGEDAYSPLYKVSRYCASCHEGTVFGVHVYGTYSEWLVSPARKQGKQCQTCHMQPTGIMTNIAPGHGGIERDPMTLANHSFFGGSQLEMLRNALHVSAKFQDKNQLDVEVRADDVGHRVPTGFPDRHLVLILEPVDAGGNRLSMQEGPALPKAAGRSVAGMAGRLYAKLLKDNSGNGPAPFWRADDAQTSDTRLTPGEPNHVQFTLPAQARQVRIRLLHRRTWPEIAESKNWPDNEMVIVDQLFEAP
jgi:hypothetical protein